MPAKKPAAAKKTVTTAAAQRPDPRASAETLAELAPPSADEVRAACIVCGMAQDEIDARIRKLRGL